MQLRHLQHLQLFAGFAFAVFAVFVAFRPVSRTGGCDFLTQNGMGGVSGIAAISATKPGILPVKISPADGELSQNEAVAPVSPPSSGTQLPFRNCRNCRHFRNNRPAWTTFRTLRPL
ncbi:MAG: hypothetical protein JNM70_02600 [Anaerolineae bacterium]|nr:hypothetical protein [Anaerolineae bacterium]